jgi:nucleoside-diphosphate-sugar epimerase
MKVLVTGAAGYIGSVLVRLLLAAGHEVAGLDALLFGGESLLGVLGHERFRLVAGDIRDEAAVGEALAGSEAVIHLAAIVGDPAAAREPELAEQVNWLGSRSLFDRSAATGSVRRFIFASTCSNYGKMAGEGFVDETSPLRPVSQYARQKVRMEEYIRDHPSRDGLVATSLRFATAYGLSPRPRFDLTVNEFTREVVKGRTLEVYGKQFWRPYCHVVDLARACQLVLEAAPPVVDHEVFGVGDTAENYQKETIAAILLEMHPEAEILYVHRDEDPRDYRVDFSKIRTALGFQISRTVRAGIEEYADAIRRRIIADPDSPKYRNT